MVTSNIPATPRPSGVGLVTDDWVAATRTALGADGPLVDRLRAAVPAGYDELTDPAIAAEDLRTIDQLLGGLAEVATSIVHEPGAPASHFWQSGATRRVRHRGC